MHARKSYAEHSQTNEKRRSTEEKIKKNVTSHVCADMCTLIQIHIQSI